MFTAKRFYTAVFSVITVIHRPVIIFGQVFFFFKSTASIHCSCMWQLSIAYNFIMYHVISVHLLLFFYCSCTSVV